jgi:hypothetical protein
MLLTLAAVLLAPPPAQDNPPEPTPAPTITAGQALRSEQALVGPVVPRKVETCDEASGNEIVVCARTEDPKTQYVPSDADSGVADDGGVPRAPDVSGLPSCAGATVCAQHLGRQPRQLYIIDLKAIPEPPPGSDADRIARGDMPAP